MGVDVDNEVAKASSVMSRYHMSQDDQVEVVRILLSAGVEHCLSEQERIREQANAVVDRAVHRGPVIH